MIEPCTRDCPEEYSEGTSPTKEPIVLPVKRCQSPISTARSSPSGSLADAGAFGERFFSYYNHNHRHCGIGLHTAASVQFGTAPEVRALRQQTLNAAHAAHPERFGNRRPQPPKLPPVAWINQPSQQAFIQTA